MLFAQPCGKHLQKIKRSVKGIRLETTRNLCVPFLEWDQSQIVECSEQGTHTGAYVACPQCPITGFARITFGSFWCWIAGRHLHETREVSVEFAEDPRVLFGMARFPALLGQTREPDCPLLTNTSPNLPSSGSWVHFLRKVLVDSSIHHCLPSSSMEVEGWASVRFTLTKWNKSPGFVPGQCSTKFLSFSERPSAVDTALQSPQSFKSGSVLLQIAEGGSRA